MVSLRKRIGLALTMAAVACGVAAAARQQAAPLQGVPPVADPGGVRAARRARRPVRGEAAALVLTDIANEPDDQMSMVRFLVYSNQFDVEGLVADHLDLDAQPVAAGRHPLRARRLRASAAEPASARSRFPTAAAAARARRRRAAGYGMAAVGAGQDVARRRADRPGGGQGRPAAALGPRLGRRQHAGAGACTCATTRPAAELEQFVAKLRVYAISDQDDAGPWIRREFPALPTSPRRPPPTASSTTSRPGPASAATGSIATPPAPTSRRSPTSGSTTHIRSKGRSASSTRSLLHPRGRHAVVPRPDRQRPRQLHEPDLTADGAAATCGGSSTASRARSGRRAATRTRAGTARATPSSAPTASRYTSDQATIWRWRSGVPARLRRAHGLDDQGRRPGEPQPGVVVNGSRGKAPLTIDARGRPARDARRRGSARPRRPRAKYSWFFYPEAGSGLPAVGSGRAGGPGVPPAPGAPSTSTTGVPSAPPGGRPAPAPRSRSTMAPRRWRRSCRTPPASRTSSLPSPTTGLRR